MQIMQNVSSTVSAPATGREAKRERTLRRVEKAAVALALQHGTEHVTVDQICEASDISARTFFNYFGSKDAAIVGTASSRNIHCQPCKPPASMPSSEVDTGAPMTFDSGRAIMNKAMMRARCCDGNQQVR